MYVGVPTDPPRGARRLTARPADPQGLGQPKGGGPPPPAAPKTVAHPVTHWLAAAPVEEIVQEGLDRLYNNVSPGDDGAGAKFYKTFQSLFVPQMYALAQESFEAGKLLEGWHIGFLNCIPKVAGRRQSSASGRSLCKMSRKSG